MEETFRLSDSNRSYGPYSLRGLLRKRTDDRKREMFGPRADVDAVVREGAEEAGRIGKKVKADKDATADTTRLSNVSKKKDSGTTAKGSSWGGSPFLGKMTVDEFVSLAGGLSHVLSPETPMGRVGGLVSQYGERSRQARKGAAETQRLEGLALSKEERKRTADIDAAELLATGVEARHLAQFGPGGTVTRGQDLAKEGREAIADTAAGRLSLATKKYDEEQAEKNYTTHASGILGGYITMTDTGEVLDPNLRPAYLRAKAMYLTNPEESLTYLKNAVKLYEAQGKVEGDGEGIGEGDGKQTQGFSVADIEERYPELTTEDISLLETYGDITPKTARALRSLRIKAKEPRPNIFYGREIPGYRTPTLSDGQMTIEDQERWEASQEAQTLKKLKLLRQKLSPNAPVQ